MIRTKHRIKTVITKGVTKTSHTVTVTITGRRDLDALATRVEQDGNLKLATLLRRARRFSMPITPKLAKELNA